MNNGKLEWTNEKKIWNWDHCTIGLVKSPEKKLRVVVRSNANKNQILMKGNRPMTLRFMFGFDIERVSMPRLESPDPRKGAEEDPKVWSGPGDRWILQLDDDYWIWEWAQEGMDISSSNVYKIYQDIDKMLSGSSQSDSGGIFHLLPDSHSDRVAIAHLNEGSSRIIPVIYQPAVDSLKNFVREVHCSQRETGAATSEVEVTIIFNNEQLREHAPLDGIYKEIRHLLYNRDQDVETFKILIDKNDPSRNRLIVENIYSFINGRNNGLNEDTIHGDPQREGRIEHPISYYFLDYDHPVVFVNTSNHAMAEHDANHELWKWEYIPGLKDSPVILGNKTREIIDAEFDSS